MVPDQLEFNWSIQGFALIYEQSRFLIRGKQRHALSNCLVFTTHV